jgi:hypothetical protein
MANARDQASQSALVTVTVFFCKTGSGRPGCGERPQLGFPRFKARAILLAKVGMAFKCDDGCRDLEERSTSHAFDLRPKRLAESRLDQAYAGSRSARRYCC